MFKIVATLLAIVFSIVTFNSASAQTVQETLNFLFDGTGGQGGAHPYKVELTDPDQCIVKITKEPGWFVTYYLNNVYLKSFTVANPNFLGAAEMTFNGPNTVVEEKQWVSKNPKLFEKPNPKTIGNPKYGKWKIQTANSHYFYFYIKDERRVFKALSYLYNTQCKGVKSAF